MQPELNWFSMDGHLGGLVHNQCLCQCPPSSILTFLGGWSQSQFLVVGSLGQRLYTFKKCWRALTFCRASLLVQSPLPFKTWQTLPLISHVCTWRWFWKGALVWEPLPHYVSQEPPGGALSFPLRLLRGALSPYSHRHCTLWNFIIFVNKVHEKCSGVVLICIFILLRKVEQLLMRFWLFVFLSLALPVRLLHPAIVTLFILDIGKNFVQVKDIYACSSVFQIFPFVYFFFWRVGGSVCLFF